jgi:hypothetical protein
VSTAFESCCDGGEEAPPFLFVAGNSELVLSLSVGLSNTALLTNADGPEWALVLGSVMVSSAEA